MLPSLNAETVKLPTSSKLPVSGLGPSNAPPGPLPGTLCQSIGASGTVLEEHAARRIDAASTGKRPTRLIWAPWKEFDGPLKDAPSDLCFKEPLVAASAAPATAGSRRGHGNGRGERRVRGVGQVAPFGSVHHRLQLIPASGEWRRHVELGAGRGDLVGDRVLVEVMDPPSDRDGDRGRSGVARDAGSRDVQGGFGRPAAARAAAGGGCECDQRDGNAAHELLRGRSDTTMRGDTTRHRRFRGTSDSNDCSGACSTGRPSTPFLRSRRCQRLARATMRNVKGTSSSTCTRPPAAVVGLIPNSDCLTVSLPSAVSVSPCKSTLSGTTIGFTMPCKERSPCTRSS